MAGFINRMASLRILLITLNAIIEGRVMKNVLFVAMIPCIFFLSTANAGTKVEKSCTAKGKKLSGRIHVVQNFPDLRVRIVQSFPDLRVKWVKSSPSKCGEWMAVENFGDIRVQFVESFEDIKIELVESFPGIP